MLRKNDTLLPVFFEAGGRAVHALNEVEESFWTLWLDDIVIRKGIDGDWRDILYDEKTTIKKFVRRYNKVADNLYSGGRLANLRRHLIKNKLVSNKSKRLVKSKPNGIFSRMLWELLLEIEYLFTQEKISSSAKCTVNDVVSFLNKNDKCLPHIIHHVFCRLFDDKELLSNDEKLLLEYCLDYIVAGNFDWRAWLVFGPWELEM